MKYLSLLLLLPLGVAACGQSDSVKTKPGTPVEIALSRSATVPHYIDALGRLAASDAVNVTPQVGGQLISAEFQQGSPVTAGQVLFRIDPRKYVAKVQEASGRLEQALAELAVRELELERNANLAKKDFVSKQQYDRYEAEVAEAKGSVLSAEGALATAQLNLEFTEVRAPVSGIAGLYQIDVGNIVGIGNNNVLTTIQTRDPLWVDIGVPGSRIEQIRHYLDKAAGSLRVEVRGLGSKSEASTASISIIDNRVSDKTGTVTLRATLANPDGTFLPGQPVQTRIHLRQVPNSILVPQSSVGVGQAGPYIFVLGDSDIVRQQAVTLGQKQGSEVVIRKGLQAGMKVVTTGRILLSDKTKVRVEKSPEPTPGKKPAS